MGNLLKILPKMGTYLITTNPTQVSFARLWPLLIEADPA